MKKIIYIVFAISFFSCADKQDVKQFEVTGTLKNSNAKMVYLEENVAGGSRPMIMDSAQLKSDGSFTLKAPAKEESLYHLRAENKLVPFALLINDVPKIKINADINNTTRPYTVENSPASQALIDFDRTTYEQGMKLFTLGSRVDSLRRIKTADSLVNTEYKTLQTAATDLKKIANDVIQKSNSPILILYCLSSFQNATGNLGIQGFTQSEVTGFINTAAGKFPAHTALQNIKKTLPPVTDTTIKSIPAAKAPDFTQPGVNGQPVSLSSFKGKYVLLDFWASWCRPCRQDNPNVVRAYQEFKDKNFTVFGVSLDESKEAWLAAIQQDGLTWTHASDLKFWSNEAAALYGVQGIPANFLIDPQGNVVAENLHGEDIVRTLRRVVK